MYIIKAVRENLVHINSRLSVEKLKIFIVRVDTNAHNKGTPLHAFTTIINKSMNE